MSAYQNPVNLLHLMAGYGPDDVGALDRLITWAEKVKRAPRALRPVPDPLVIPQIPQE